jgi:hypothetical protein
MERKFKTGGSMENNDIAKSIDELRHEMTVFRKIIGDNAKDNTNFAETLVIFNTFILFFDSMESMVATKQPHYANHCIAG